MIHLLPDRVRAAREQYGWTQEELAARAGLSRNHIVLIETGQRPNLAANTVDALADALSRTADWLMGRDHVTHGCFCRCPCHATRSIKQHPA